MSEKSIFEMNPDELHEKHLSDRAVAFAEWIFKSMPNHSDRKKWCFSLNGPLTTTELYKLFLKTFEDK